MKKKYLYIAITSIFLIICIIVLIPGLKKNKDYNAMLLPSLPKPIAKEYALITSAGQSTDAYIINDISNRLMIHSYFMPQARAEDLTGVKTVVFVIGNSFLGEKTHGISFNDEKDRIEEMIKKANDEMLTIIAVYIGGSERRSKETDELLKLICPNVDYLIATKSGDFDDYLSELTERKRTPLTLVSEVSDIEEPFASAFR
jgi:hypothetical protein